MISSCSSKTVQVTKLLSSNYKNTENYFLLRIIRNSLKMYHKIDVERLSPTQIGKLLNGHRIRVKHGRGHQIHVSEEQHKKITKAHRKGAGVNIQLDPYAIDHNQHLRGHSHHSHHAHHGLGLHGYRQGHGEGFLDDVRGFFSPVERALAPLAPIAKSVAKTVLPGVIEKYAPIAAPIANPIIAGLGVARRRRGRGHGKAHSHKGGLLGTALMPAGYGLGRRRGRR